MERVKIMMYRWLKKVEPFLKTDIIYLVKGMSFLGISQVVTAVSVFLLAVASANLLPQESYGTYRYILSLATVISALSLTGFNTTVMIETARGHEGVLRFAFWKNLKWSVGMVFASLFCFLYYFLNDNHTLALSFLVIAFFSPILSSASFYSAYLSGKKEFGTVATYGSLASIFQAIIFFLAMLATDRPFVLALAYFASNTLVTLFFYQLTLKKYPPNDDIGETTLQRGFHFSVFNFLKNAVSQIDKILIFHYLGPVELAIFAFAQAPISQMGGMLKLFFPLAFPKLSEQEKEGVKKFLPGKIRKFFIFVIIPVVLYIFFAPFLYKIFFPKYLDAIIYSQVFALTLLFFPNKLAGIALQVHGSNKAMYVSSLSDTFVRVLLLLTLVPTYGIWGAIATEITLNAVSNMTTWYLFRKM